jgi:mono/diheme cytochrome c family protein
MPRSSRRCCRGNSRRQVTDTKRAAPAPGRLACARLILAAVALLFNLPPGPAHAEEGLNNPFLGKPEAISAGRDIYQRKCLVCHQSAGARGPNLFATKLNDQRFLETVIKGRKGTQMPAFGARLSIDEVWQVHAFVKSTDHY